MPKRAQAEKGLKGFETVCVDNWQAVGQRSL